VDHQFDLFGEEPERPAARRRDAGKVRRHVPGAGERGIPLTDPQAAIVDWVVERMADREDLRGHAIPVRVDAVLYLPRDMEVVADVMDLLDEHLPDPAWRRAADRLAQGLHEWWAGS
jgi:hypothetical protein